MFPEKNQAFAKSRLTHDRYNSTNEGEHNYLSNYLAVKSTDIRYATQRSV